VPAAGRPDAATQRNWLQLGASAGEAAVSLRDVALAVLRSADLLALRIGLDSPGRRSGLPALLVPALAGRDGTLIAGFAPQHLVEPSSRRVRTAACREPAAGPRGWPSPFRRGTRASRSTRPCSTGRPSRRA
jgi:hypothetical protein